MTEPTAVTKLLVAASDGPWQTNPWADVCRDDGLVLFLRGTSGFLNVDPSEEDRANARLAALVHDMARAGEAMLAQLELEERWYLHWGGCDVCSGTPLLCDAGFGLVQEAKENRHVGVNAWRKLGVN